MVSIGLNCPCCAFQELWSGWYCQSKWNTTLFTWSMIHVGTKSGKGLMHSIYYICCMYQCSLVPRPYKHFHCNLHKTLLKLLWVPLGTLTLLFGFTTKCTTHWIVEVITDSLYKLNTILGFSTVSTILSPEMQSLMFIWCIMLINHAMHITSYQTEIV